MKAKALLIAAIFFGLLGSLTPAQATTVDVLSCFDFDKEFDDAAYGDYSTNNGAHTAAAGLYVKLQREVSAGVWYTQWEGYTNKSTGCVVLSHTVGNTYRFRMGAKAHVGDNDDSSVTNDFIVHNDFTYSTYWGQATYSWTQGSENSHDFLYTYGATYEVSNILAAATKSLRYYNVGVEDELLRYVTDDCPDTGSSCYSHEDSRVALSASGRGSKFTIAHETGHFMHWHLNDFYGGEYILTGCNEYSCPDPDCSDGDDSHSWRSQENQGCAAKEGHADYYAAAVYNDWNETDCDYKSNDCGANETWMETRCPLYAYKRGVESDWAQFYWDLTSVNGWGVRLVTQLFVEPDNEWDHAEVWETLRDSVLALHPTLYLPFVLSGDTNGINH